MKKITLKITKWTKLICLAIALLGAPAVMGYVQPKAAIKLSFTFGLVAALKKKNVELDAGQEAFVKTLEEEIQQALDDATEGVITAEKFNESFAEKLTELEGKLADSEKFKKLENILKAQGIFLQGLKVDKGATRENGIKSLRDQMNDILTDPTKKAKWDEWKQSGGKGWFDMELKAAITMTIVQNNTDYPSGYIPQPAFVPGLVNLVRNRPFIKQFANYGSTNSPKIVWVEKRNPQGTAQFIGEGVAAPLGSFEMQPMTSDAKKVVEKIKVSNEMLTDIDFIAAEIQNELLYQIEISVDNGLLSGNGVGDNIKGLTAYVGGYVLTSIATTAPNNADAIRAAIAQIASLNFMANYAFVNPIDAANMDLVKTTQNAYVTPLQFLGNGVSNVKGVNIVETNQIPQGYVLVGDMTRFIVRDYVAFFVQFGWENDDFTKGLVTVLGTNRLHSYLPTNHVGAFVYDTYVNIKTAITAV